MRRIVSIWLPQWPIDRLRRAEQKRPTSSCSGVLDDAKPFVLTAAVNGAQQLTAINPAAEEGGLSLAMTLAHARSLLPDVRTAGADPDADRLALGWLADWCGRYSPATGVDSRSGVVGDHGLWIDVTGCCHLFGGEQDLLDDLGHSLTRMGIDHRLGMASTLGAAWAIARFHSGTPIVQPRDIFQTLDALSVASLRLLPETVILLKRLGLTRIGLLEAVPRVALAKRFSSKDIGAAVLRRLDQAFGRQEEPLSPQQPQPVYRAIHRFIEPIGHVPAVAHALELMMHDLCRMLDRAGQGAERLSLLVYRVDGDVRRLPVGASQPTRDRQHIERLFAERLETIDAGFGIEQLALHADQVAPLQQQQKALTYDLADSGMSDDRLAQLIDRLANRLGADAVTVSVPFASYVPERSEQLVSVLERQGEQRQITWQERPSRPPRPTSLLPHPEPIAAMASVPDGPPMTFTWRRVVRRIIRSEGPERIGPEWWLDQEIEPEPTRDYYRVEDERGQRYWLFRAGLYDDVDRRAAPNWFIHGLFG